MQVETYECSETAAEPIEACEEALSLIEQLGLEGQKSLVSRREERPASRIPYREMTAEERFVYGVLCPDKSKLAEYDVGPIPLRVLQIAAHADSLQFYSAFTVWHAQKQLAPDPVLVGLPNGATEYSNKFHILARWGEELESWPTLLKRAVEKKRMEIAERLRRIQRGVEAMIGAGDMLDAELVQKGADWKPSFYA